jgi:Cys-rich repeat protein
MCVACLTSSDCPNANQTCTANQCQWNLGYCGSDADCATLSNTPICDTTQDLCVQCVANTDCAQGYVCDQTEQMCVQSTPTPCSSNSQCTSVPGMPYCDTAAGTCVQCLTGSSSECQRGLVCENDICVSSAKDGGTNDGGELGRDAGVATDAGGADAGEMPDSGSEADAGRPVDAGTVADAGRVPDAGVTDAGSMPVDAGQPSSDAGSVSSDAGSTVDAGLSGSCMSDSDCTDTAAPVCLTATGVCVGCLWSGDCNSGACETADCTCTDDNQCAVVGNCSSSSDCTDPTLPVCDMTFGNCVGCIYNSDCPAGDVCNIGETCEPVPPPQQCQDFVDCLDPGAWYCGPNGVCDQCDQSGQGQCPGDDICNNGTCAGPVPDGGTSTDAGGSGTDAGPPVDAGPCAANSDCTTSISGSICDVDAGACVECNGGNPCAGGATCTNGACLTQTVTTGSCGRDADCAGNAAGPFCDRTTGYCVQCDGTHACPSGQTCEFGVCVSGAGLTCTTNNDCTNSSLPQCDTSFGLCVECTDNNQCSNGSTCHAGACSAQLMGCTDSSSCSDPTPVCDTNLEMCVACSPTSACTGSGQVCLGYTCETSGTPLGCKALVECEYPCLDATCYTACDSAASSTAALLYDSLWQCLNINCQNSFNMPICISHAQTAGGACYEQLTACLQDQ